MYHLTADSEVVFFFVPFMRHGRLVYFFCGGVGRRYSMGFNLGWRDIKIPVGFWRLTGICWVWGRCGTAFS